MRQLFLVLFFGVALAATAPAQVYSQPIRDVEKEARGAVHGRCNLQLDPGGSGIMANCTLYALTQVIGEPVPAGKILVIEDISASCSQSNQDLTTFVLLRNGTMWKPLPLQLIRTLSNGRQVWVSSQRARMYVKAGDIVSVSIDSGNNATQLVNCGVLFQGHLVNAN